MNYLGVLRYKNQPIERKTEVSGDLRTVINQTFLMVQNAAFECADVEAAVWEESGKPGASHVKVLPISMNATKLPALLMRPAAVAGPSQPMLTDGNAPAVPSRAACPFCEGVADLVENYQGLSFRYACPDCGFQSTYSPAQLAAWSTKHPIRKDGNRLTMPKPSNDEVTALASWKGEGGFWLLVLSKSNWGDRLGIERVQPGGERAHGGTEWRSAKDRTDLLGIARTWLSDKPEAEIHDAELEAAAPTPLWLPVPEPATTDEELRAICQEPGYESFRVWQLDGSWADHNSGLRLKGDALASGKQSVPLSEIGMLVQTTRYGSQYGPEPRRIVRWKRPGFEPPAPKEKKPKGKGATAAPEAEDMHPVAMAERLEEYINHYLDDPEQPVDGPVADLHKETEDAIYDGTIVDDAEVLAPLLSRWAEVYPDLQVAA